MCRIFATTGALLLLSTFSIPAHAQQSTLPPPGTGREGSESTPITAIISGPSDVPLGQTIILDAAQSHLVRENIRYRWYMGEGKEPISKRGEMLYTPDRPGSFTFRLVINSTVEGEVRESVDEYGVRVYRRKILLLAQASTLDEELNLLAKAAEERGDYLQVLQAPATRLPVSTEGALASLVAREPASLRGATFIVAWTDGIDGLQALVHAQQREEGGDIDLTDKTLILVTRHHLPFIARIARGLMATLRPSQMLITRAAALPLLIESSTKEAFLSQLTQRTVDLLILNPGRTQLLPWDLLSALTNAMLVRGVDSQTVILLLMLPIIATLFAFFKQVIGITSFGLYIPSIITLSFFALGWQVGLLFLLFILLTGTLTRSAMRYWRLLYIPKVAVILTVVSLTLLLLTAVGASVGITIEPNTIFILLIMSTLAENLLNVKLEEGLSSALLGIGETIFGALLCVFLIRSPSFQTLILAHPELILLTVLVNIALGRWTGLRLVEYVRFREVFRHLQEE